LTHPRNAGRSDLRCAFGCKDAHRKRSSLQRSEEYYGTKEGKFKKKMQNGKRAKSKAKLNSRNPPEDARQDPAPDGYRFDADMVCYVRMVTSLIEGRRVSMDEILEMLARAVRQRSMARSRRIDYVLRYLMKNAP
jgi:hypothetical protein